jgi:hypothetical protein
MLVMLGLGLQAAISVKFLNCLVGLNLRLV